MRLDQNKFKAWLKEKPPQEIVGENRDCHSCPIAKFYSDSTDGGEIVIFQNEWCDYIIDRGYIKTKAPSWAAEFIFTVDGDANGKISAGRALDVLSQS